MPFVYEATFHEPQIVPKKILTLETWEKLQWKGLEIVHRKPWISPIKIWMITWAPWIGNHQISQVSTPQIFEAEHFSVKHFTKCCSTPETHFRFSTRIQKNEI